MLFSQSCGLNCLIFAILFGVLLTGNHGMTVNTDTNVLPFPWDKMRLPETVKPQHYELLIHPNLTSLTFTGVVQILVEVEQDTRAIILHSKNLQISKAQLLESRHHHRDLQISEFEANEQIALFADGFTFEKGNHLVHLEFYANLSDSFHGFYQGRYITNSGEKRYGNYDISAF